MIVRERIIFDENSVIIEFIGVIVYNHIIRFVLHINSSAIGLYIFDEDHLYYTTADNRLHRIRPDDTGNESVF